MPADRPARIEPAQGQESVWDYPRPPIVVPTEERVRVIHRGTVLVDTRSAVRVLETSQPPAYYIPRRDVLADALVRTERRTHCEWKGGATYWTVRVPGATGPDAEAIDAAWSYEDPVAAFAAIRGYVAFYAQRVDECWVDDERVAPNPGSFYGGWITSKVVGPFKGDPGTSAW